MRSHWLFYLDHVPLFWFSLYSVRFPWQFPHWPWVESLLNYRAGNLFWVSRCLRVRGRCGAIERAGRLCLGVSDLLCLCLLNPPFLLTFCPLTWGVVGAASTCRPHRPVSSSDFIFFFMSFSSWRFLSPSSHAWPVFSSCLASSLRFPSLPFLSAVLLCCQSDLPLWNLKFSSC